MKIDYRPTVRACFAGYVVQAIVNNLAPLLFVTFQAQFGISLSRITLLVSVNGIRYSIQRGKRVTVPWAVAQVIEQSEKSDLALMKRIEELSRNPYVTIR